MDLVAGTSIGGLLGGGYSMGMSPAELASLMRETDWDRMFQSDSPFADKTFRRKQDKRAYPARLEFGVRHGLTLPQSLNPGQQVALLLDRIALAYFDLRSFDDLPTPYRCVAADLRSLEPIVLDRGPLARAMRATMAIPGVFAPVAVGDWLLVDGGVLNNVPGDVVRDAGADVVIAVDVSSASTNPDVLTSGSSMLSLLGRTLDVMMAAGARKGLDAATIVLRPDLSGLDSMSWRQSEEFAARGYQAAARLSSRLLPYAVSQADYAAYLESRRARRRTAAPEPVSVRVVGIPKADQELVAAALVHHLGRPVDVGRLERDLLAIGGSDRYAYLSYRVTTETGQPELEVLVQPKSNGPPFLALGLELGTVSSTSVAGNLSARLTDYDTFAQGRKSASISCLGRGRVSPRRFSGAPGGARRSSSRRGSPSSAPALPATPATASRPTRRSCAQAPALTSVSCWHAAPRSASATTWPQRRSHLRVGDSKTAEMNGAERFASRRLIFDGQDSPMIPSKGLRFRRRSGVTSFAPHGGSHPAGEGREGHATLLAGGGLHLADQARPRP